MDRAFEAFGTAQLQQQPVALHPAGAGVTHLDCHPVARDRVGGGLLAGTGRGDADRADAIDHQGVEHHWQTIDQMGLDDGAGAAAHHRQVHHQGEGLPVHQVGGGAVVGPGEVFGALDPVGATDPQPATRREGLLMALHTPQQLNLVVVEVAKLAQALQVAFGHLMPTLAAGWGLAGIGAIKHRVGGRGCRWEHLASFCILTTPRLTRSATGLRRSRFRQGSEFGPEFGPGRGEGHSGADQGEWHPNAISGVVKQAAAPVAVALASSPRRALT